ncbi:MAG TPA: hypothetical protein V6D17_09395 [Candidatus Obscuribacterales bacterium]
MQNSDANTRWAMAVNPNTPAMVLAELIDDSPPHILERIAENPRTNAEALARLAVCEWPSVRAAVADNANTPKDIVFLLMRDESVDVRYSIAENHNMPAEVLFALSEDDNPYVAMRASRTLARIQGQNLLYGHFPQSEDEGEQLSQQSG